MRNVRKVCRMRGDVSVETLKFLTVVPNVSRRRLWDTRQRGASHLCENGNGLKDFAVCSLTPSSPTPWRHARKLRRLFGLPMFSGMSPLVPRGHIRRKQTPCSTENSAQISIVNPCLPMSTKSENRASNSLTVEEAEVQTVKESEIKFQI